ncbi:hypothetical protein Ciccas_013818, partial [Cichlidogyrus casuarinus]
DVAEEIAERIEEVLSRTECTNIVFIGDFNQNKIVQRAAESHNLTQKVNFSTRKENMLDLVYASEAIIETIEPKNILPRCDHVQIQMKVHIQPSCFNHEIEEKMTIKYVDREELRKRLAEIDIMEFGSDTIDSFFPKLFATHKRIEEECTKTEIKYPSINARLFQLTKRKENNYKRYRYEPEIADKFNKIIDEELEEL